MYFDIGQRAHPHCVFDCRIPAQLRAASVLLQASASTHPMWIAKQDGGLPHTPFHENVDVLNARIEEIFDLLILYDLYNK